MWLNLIKNIQYNYVYKLYDFSSNNKSYHIVEWMWGQKEEEERGEPGPHIHSYQKKPWGVEIVGRRALLSVDPHGMLRDSKLFSQVSRTKPLSLILFHFKFAQNVIIIMCWILEFFSLCIEMNIWFFFFADLSKYNSRLSKSNHPCSHGNKPNLVTSIFLCQLANFSISMFIKEIILQLLFLGPSLSWFFY